MGFSLSTESVVSIDSFSREDLQNLIDLAKEFKEKDRKGERYSVDLRDKVLVHAFFEPSTRTRLSFERAMKELGGDVFGFDDPGKTSLKKGESLLMTIKMLEAYHANALVMRHPKAGSVQRVADICNIPVINAGDGPNEHPTQAFLDLFTLNEIHPGIDGIHIGFVGDLKYGRTVRSNIVALPKFDDVVIHWAAHDAFAMPDDLVKLAEDRGIKIFRCDSVDDVLKESEVCYTTRPQKERVVGRYDIAEIAKMVENYKITIDLIRRANPDVRIMHPLPIDTNTEEIEDAVTFSDNQYYLAQAENGIFVRKALLFALLGGIEHRVFEPYVNSALSESNGNLELYRRSGRRKKDGRIIADIEDGFVIDHITLGEGSDLAKELEIDKYRLHILAGLDSTSYDRKEVIKLSNVLGEKDIRRVVLISPEATFSIVSGGKVVYKFRALLCENEACITQDVLEGVPRNFFYDGHEIRCRYCKSPIEPKVKHEGELKRYVKSLPAFE